MTARALLFLVKLGILGALVAYFTVYPGAVSIEFRGWRADMPVGLLLLAVLVLALLLAFGDRIRRGVVRLPGRLKESRARSRRTRGYQALTQGMVAVAAGDKNEAARQAKRADALLDDPALTRLLSAQSAQLNGQDDAARRYFEGMLDDPSTAFMGVRGLMMQALKAGDRARALELAERADALRPGTPWVLRELLELQQEQGRRQAALATLDRAGRAKAIPEVEVGRRRADLLMTEAKAQRREGMTRTALKTAQQALKSDPRSIEAVRLAASLLREEGRSRKAEKLVEDAWRTEPDPQLAEIYRDLAPTGTTALGQVKRMEKLRGLAPDHPEAHLSLAQASLDAQLWGEARNHLTPLVGAQPSPRICRMMARLEEEERGDLEAARDWLARAAGDAEAQDAVADDEDESETDADARPAALPSRPAVGVVEPV
ncbi:MAG: heme biosynthesis HemY N-terminal domain-containing protein [Marivibrio sp.]|uniref:heme biosynthesis protein HemY n=1 Tax=Marivibrio sp. TaxID=2039719 RepID=UPI0032EC8D71